MRIASTKHFTISLPSPTGGKAGKGLGKTSTIQVRRHDYIVKQFRYKVPDGKQAAINRAWGWAVEHELQIAEGNKAALYL